MKTILRDSRNIELIDYFDSLIENTFVSFANDMKACIGDDYKMIKLLCDFTDQKQIEQNVTLAATHSNISFIIHVIKYTKNRSIDMIPTFNNCMRIGSEKKDEEITFGLLFNLLPSFGILDCIHPKIYSSKKDYDSFYTTYKNIKAHANKKFNRQFNKSRSICRTDIKLNKIKKEHIKSDIGMYFVLDVENIILEYLQL